MANPRQWLEELSDDTREEIAGLEDAMDDTFIREMQLAQIREKRAPVPSRVDHVPDSDIREQLLQRFQIKPDKQRSIEEKINKHHVLIEQLQRLFEPIRALEDEIPRTEERAEEIIHQIEEQKNVIFKVFKQKEELPPEERDKPKDTPEELKEKANGLVEFGRFLFPNIRDNFRLASKLYPVLEPIFSEYQRNLERPHLTEAQKEAALLSGQRLIYLVECLVDILHNYKRKYALFDVSYISLQTMMETDIGRKVNESIEKLNQLIKSLYDRRKATKAMAKHIIRRHEDNAKLIDIMNVHNNYLTLKIEGARVDKLLLEEHRKKKYKEPELLESKMDGFRQEMEADRALTQRLELERRQVAPLMMELARLTRARTNEEMQRMRGMVDIFRLFEMSDSFTDAILRSVEENLEPDVRRIKKYVFEWIDLQEMEMLKKKQGIERERMLQMDTEQMISGMADELIMARAEYRRLCDRSSYLQSGIDRIKPILSSKREQLNTLKQDLRNLVPAAMQESADSRLLLGTASMHHDAPSPSQFKRVPAPRPPTPLQPQSHYSITSQDYAGAQAPPHSQRKTEITSQRYLHERSPHPEPSRVIPTGKKRDQELLTLYYKKPQTHGMPQAHFEYPYTTDHQSTPSVAQTPPLILDSSARTVGSTTALNRTVLLTSPTREPLLLDIDIDPKPLTTTEDGERFICDISLNVREAGNE